MILSAIVCTDKDGGIGKDNTMPWRNKEDMAFFKEKTTNKLVVMGSATYWSLPDKFRPLPDRYSLVYSSNGNKIIEDSTLDRTNGGVGVINGMRRTEINETSRNLFQQFTAKVVNEECTQYDTDEVFIIGGATIYNQFLPYIDQLYINVLFDSYDCDTFFPALPRELQMKSATKFDTFTSYVYVRE